MSFQAASWDSTSPVQLLELRVTWSFASNKPFTGSRYLINQNRTGTVSQHTSKKIPNRRTECLWNCFTSFEDYPNNPKPAHPCLMMIVRVFP